MKTNDIMAALAGLVCLVGCDSGDGIGTLPSPQNLSVVLDERMITLTWDDVQEADAYVVYYGVTGENSYSKSDILYQTRFEVEDCRQGVTYEFKVRAATGSAVSPFSETASIAVPAPEVPDIPTVETPVISNVRAGLGWINLTIAKPAADCSYALYDGKSEVSSAVFEKIGENEDGSIEYSIGGLELGKTYESLSVKAMIEDYNDSDPADVPTLTTGTINVLGANPSPCHVGFEWDDVAANANWTFGEVDALTRTYKIELASDESFTDIIYSFYTVDNFMRGGASYIYGNWTGQSGTPESPSKPYAASMTNIVIGQLNPSTTYYFRVRAAAGETVKDEVVGTDIQMNATCGRSTWSPAVPATTASSHVAGIGELLYQGFDDHAVGSDHINCASGMVPSVGSDAASYRYPWKGDWGVFTPGTGLRYDELGASSTGTFPGNGESKLDNMAVYRMNADVIPSMNGWFCAKACYPQQAALKLGGSAGQKNFIITPAFSSLTEETSVSISFKAGAAHASATPAKLHVKIYRAASSALEALSTFDLPVSASTLNPNGDGYHNRVEMLSYSIDATLQPGDYVMFEAETIKSPATNRLVIDDILIEKK